MCFLMTTSNCSFASLLLSLEKTWVSLLQPYFWFPGQGFLPQKVYFHFLGLNLSLCMFFVPFSVCKEKPMWNITGDITLCMQWNITVWSQCIDIWIPKIFLMMVSVLVWYKWFHDSKEGCSELVGVSNTIQPDRPDQHSAGAQSLERVSSGKMSMFLEILFPTDTQMHAWEQYPTATHSHPTSFFLSVITLVVFVSCHDHKLFSNHECFECLTRKKTSNNVLRHW